MPRPIVSRNRKKDSVKPAERRVHLRTISSGDWKHCVWIKTIPWKRHGSSKMEIYYATVIRIIILLFGQMFLSKLHLKPINNVTLIKCFYIIFSFAWKCNINHFLLERIQPSNFPFKNNSLSLFNDKCSQINNC